MRDPWRRRTPWAIAAAILLILGAVAALLWMLAPDWTRQGYDVIAAGDLAGIREWIRSAGYWGPVILIALMSLQMFLLVVPSWLLMIAAVLVYGPWAGGALAVLAIVIAAAVGYAIGRIAGQPTIDALLGDQTQAWVHRQTDRYGLWAVVITRLNPLLSNDAISILAGAVQLRFSQFMLATLAGIVPLAIATAVLGAQAKDAKTMLVAMSGLVAASLIGRIAWRRYTRV
jgi:uncharacterized membrane protein YdjX (TVP38/TMEM64 family)